VRVSSVGDLQARAFLRSCVIASDSHGVEHGVAFLVGTFVLAWKWVADASEV
jgi:hypothetical protein